MPAFFSAGSYRKTAGLNSVKIPASHDLLGEDYAMLRMGLPPLRIEMPRKIQSMEFEDCWPRRVVIEDNDLLITTISL
jgi:hypothetical protein